jgi:thiamine-monophosphate kinase
LYGGDTVQSPAGIMLAVTAFGSVPTGGMLRRTTAQAGDDLYVTGSIGDAALALEAKLNHRLFPSASKMMFDSRLHLPAPRLAFGQGLRGIAHAVMDVSDGLVQDAGHIAESAGLQVVIEAAAVPLSLAARGALADDAALLAAILTGGDDYELLFTASPDAAGRVATLGRSHSLAVRRIGRVGPGRGVVVRDGDGKPLALAKAGFQHFGGSVE